MSDHSSASYRPEVEAIGAVLASLEPLSGPARERVLVYVANALNVAAPVLDVGSPSSSPQSALRTLSPETSMVTAPPTVVVTRHTDIRSLRESKEPRSAIEMAAIVAYYLNDVAPEGERSQTISTSDLDKYFKQAGYRLSKVQNMTLVKAMAAGYFDRSGQGQYKLNPVGYNLVVHNLPAHSSQSGAGGHAVKRTRPAKKSAPTKMPVVKKSAPMKKPVVKKTVARLAENAASTEPTV